MSDTHKKEERSSGGGEDDGKNRRRRGGFVRYKRHFTRVARNVLVPFKKAKKHLCHPPRSRPRQRDNRPGLWGCLCFGETQTLDSQTTDPNDPESFAYDTLKALVEKNDFHSRECNPHI